MDERPGEYAQLWLSELGAWVPEHRDGAALAPRVKQFGRGLPADDRAARNSANLVAEPSRAWHHNAWRARPDDTSRRA